MSEESCRSPDYACESSAFTIDHAVSVLGQRERQFMLSNYEAVILAEHWIREYTEIDAAYELLQSTGSSEVRIQSYIMARIDGLIEAGYFTLEHVALMFARERQRRGLLFDTERQERESAAGKFTLFFDLAESEFDSFNNWVERQKLDGVRIVSEFHFGPHTIGIGRYMVEKLKGWSLPDSHPRWKAEVTYAACPLIDSDLGIDLQRELEQHAGTWADSGHCWWNRACDQSDVATDDDGLNLISTDELRESTITGSVPFDWHML